MLPDRDDVKMTVPVHARLRGAARATCHRRGAFAMGGMAALIPSRTDPEANERAIDAVRADKEREAGDGFDGTWVAHPDVVGVAQAAFDAVLGDRPNQIERQRRDDVDGRRRASCWTPPRRRARSPRRGCAATSASASSTSRSGSAAAAPRASTTSWRTPRRPRSPARRSGSGSATGRGSRTAARSRASSCASSSTRRLARIRAEVGEEVWAEGPARTRRARVFERVALGDDFPEFLTLPAYELLD